MNEELQRLLEQLDGVQLEEEQSGTLIDICREIPLSSVPDPDL